MIVIGSRSCPGAPLYRFPDEQLTSIETSSADGPCDKILGDAINVPNALQTLTNPTSWRILLSGLSDVPVVFGWDRTSKLLVGMGVNGTWDVCQIGLLLAS